MKIRMMAAAAALALVCAGASASVLKGPSGPNGVVVNTKTGVAVVTAPDMTEAVQSPVTPTGAKIFSNLSKAKKGRYICCYGYQLNGPAAGTTHWYAAPFTPATSTTVKTIQVALSYKSGTNSAIVTLNSDTSGVPGTQLASFTVSGLPNEGTCCALATVNSSAGVAVTAGHQYWVTVRTPTTGTGSNTVAVWNSNDVNQVDTQSGAANNNMGWGTTNFLPALAFAVYGP
jgi:hypothetical protein